MAIHTTGSSYFPDQASGLHSDIFCPPRTPGSQHDPNAYASSPSLTRKRSRADSVKANSSAAITYGSKDVWTPRDTSPPPLANTRYTLAGGFDTPTLAAVTRRDDADDLSGERNFRRTWDTQALSPQYDSTFGPLARERNGKARVVSTASFDEPVRSNGWGNFVLSLVGGVAEKMWHFCRESAFKGFYAGSGQGYDFAEATQLPSPLPGQYPSNDFYGDFEQDNTSLRPAKRQHTETGSGWVLVDHNPEPSRPSARKISSGNLTHLGATRASSRRPLNGAMRPRGPSRQVSYTGSPQAPPRLDAFNQAFAYNDRPASTASTRSPAAIHTRSPAASRLRSPIVSHHRSNSNGSRPGTAGSGPMSPDAQRYLHKIGRQDRDADKSMRKMSRQVQELIRQGQAALGTKFEVQGDVDDDTDDWEDAAAQKS